jgi:hypothetical protein
VTLIAKAVSGSDHGELTISRRNLTTGGLDAKLTDVFSDRTMMVSTKYPCEMNGMNADGSSNLVKRQRLGEMSVKKLPGLLKRFRWFAPKCLWLAPGQVGHHFQRQTFNSE